MTSSLLNPDLFRPDAVSEETRTLNAAIVQAMTPMPEWWDVGAEATREARRQGRGPFHVPRSGRSRAFRCG